MSKNIQIQKVYSNKDILEEMQNFFVNEGFLQLDNFLDNFKDIRTKIEKEKFDLVYLPLECRKSILDLNKIKDFEVIKFIEFFRSKDFIEYVESLLGAELSLKNFEVVKYSHEDFLILNDEVNNDERLEVYFDITKDWEDNFGGRLTYTTRDTEVFYLEPKYNSFTMVYKLSELMKYLKYINCLSKDNSIIRIEMSFEIMD